MKLTSIQRQSVERIRSRLLSREYSTESVGCFCGSDGSRFLSDTDRHGIPSRTLLCRSCGLIYVSPRMTEDTLKRFYNEEYFPLYASASYETEEDLFQIQRQQGFNLLRRLAEHGFAGNGRVFDIGCGTGGMLSAFFDQGWDVMGVDFSENLVSFARSRLGDCIRVGDLSAFEVSREVDLVLMSHVVEHVSHLTGFLVRLRKILRTGGAVFLVTPGVRIFGVRLFGLKPYLLNMHLYYFSLGTLSMVMGSAGFSLQRGDENIYALFRKEECVPDSLDSPGDPGLYAFLRKAHLLRPLWMALWPLWKIKNRLS
jgi:SAM-dependent methyltransferase